MRNIKINSAHKETGSDSLVAQGAKRTNSAELVSALVRETALREELEKTGLLVKARDEQISRLHEDRVALDQRLSRCVERERTRIARELHDGVAQSLGVIKYNLEWFEECSQGKLSEACALSINTAISLSRTTCRELRRIISNTMPVEIETFGLAGALNYLCEQLNSCLQDTRVTCAVNVNEDEISESLKTTIFRISQEALNNALTHAGASLVELLLSVEDGVLRLDIIDDGVGFVVEDVLCSDGNRLGLTNMKSRAGVVSGTLSILSKPGHGCKVEGLFNTA